MRQHSKGLGQWPTGHSIGGKALVKDTDRSFQTLVRQIQIESRQINRHHQTFVTENIGTETGNMEAAIFSQLLLSLAAAHK